MAAGGDLFEALMDRLAEAVGRKIDERQKIDRIAEAVLAREGAKGREGPKGDQAATLKRRPKRDRGRG